MAGSTFNELAAALTGNFGTTVLAVEEGNRIPFVRVEADAVARVARFLRDDPALAFDFLMYVTAVDYPEEEKLTLLYQYFSYQHEHSLLVKADVPRHGAEVPTVSHLYAAADWLEREVYDLFGVAFRDHPNLARILTPEGFEGHPLLKDFSNEDYVPFPDWKPEK